MKVSPLIFLKIFSFIILGAADDPNILERIHACHTKCSQGLDCRTSHSLFPRPCQTPPEGLNVPRVFQNISLSTVLSCEDRRKCSLHLRIQTGLWLRDSIHGVSICTSSPGLIQNCRIISFSKDSRERHSGSLVVIENDCTKLSPSQEVKITVEAFPPYCGIEWTRKYIAPGCTNGDLRNHVPDCITGKLSYKVNAENKSLAVTVSEMRDGHNYNLRLCHAKGIICVGSEPPRVIKKDDPIKTVTLSYSRPVPCLCIEGWSAVTDARRVQVCPFRQHVNELWTGINFDPIETSLSWQPLCPVTARITLCQKQQDGDCIDLPNSSQNVTRKKVKFTGVEPHYQLCLKFSVDFEDWIRCPFAEEGFLARGVDVSRHHEEELLFSSTPGVFSVELCEVKHVVPQKSCQSQGNYTITLEKKKSAKIQIPKEILQSTFCVQVKRLNLTYAVTAVHCFDPMSQSKPLSSLNPAWMIVAAGALLAFIILISLGLHIWLTVQRRTQRKTGACPYENQKDGSTASAFRGEPGDVLVPDSPQSGNNEKAVLLCDAQEQ